MKLREHFAIREHGGKKYAVASGDAANYFNGMLELNDTAAFMLELLKEETSESLMADAVMKKFNAERTEVLQDVNIFVRQLRSANLLEE